MCTRSIVIVAGLAVGCGGAGSSVAPSSVEAAPAASSELSPALTPLSWWLGDWEHDGGREHWVASAGAIYGVAFDHHGGFEAMIVDDGDGPGPADGALRFIAMPNGAPAVEFRHNQSTANGATFTNPAHDDPKAIGYRREGDRLRAIVEGSTRIELEMRATSREPAPELEAADRAFSADTAKRGVDGWIAAFEPGGAMMRRGQRIEGHDAIRAAMTPVLGAGRLTWTPSASGLAETLGFTIGKATFEAATPADNWRSSYVTIWRKQPDGSWKVWFDVGRVVNE
ncbi:MAG: hypothetical protein AB7O24_12355 [Kofleriaceae bacterium]